MTLSVRFISGVSLVGFILDAFPVTFDPRECGQILAHRRSRGFGVARLHRRQNLLMISAGQLPGVIHVARDQRARARYKRRHAQPQRLDQGCLGLVVGNAIEKDESLVMEMASAVHSMPDETVN